MTKFQANYVKYLRVKLDGSWRWVAGMYYKRYVDKIPFDLWPIIDGNQLTGINLCHRAMLLLEETNEDGWN